MKTASGSTTPNSTTLASNASYRPTSMPPPVPRIEPVSTSGVNKEELILLIQDLQNELATMVRTYSGDKERLKSAIITNEDYQTSQMNKSSTLGTFFCYFFAFFFTYSYFFRRCRFWNSTNCFIKANFKSSSETKRYVAWKIAKNIPRGWYYWYTSGEYFTNF